MHWLLQKLNSFGNKTAVIADQEMSYAELVAKVQNYTTSTPIQTSTGLSAVLEILSRLENNQIVCFKDIDKNKLPDVRPLLVLETSGTTGKPKQVMHDFNLFVEKYRNRTQPISTVLTYPLNHIAGIDVMFSVLSAGGKLVIPEDNTPSTVLRLIEKHQLDFLACTPTFLRLLLLSGAMGEFDLNSLRQISYGAERMSSEWLQVLTKRLPQVTFRQTYGTTETGVLKIHSDNTTWLKPNSAVVLKGEELGLKLPDSFLGYVEGEPTIENGYIYLGDTFKLKGDEVQITGRQSLMINVGGQKVNPAEVEEVLYKHKDINYCKVYGEANALMGNIVVADVYGGEDEKVIRQHCQKHLAAYKVPQKINKVTQIPITDRWKN